MDKYKILIADEDNDTRTELCDYLTGTHNFVVVALGNGLDVVKKIETEKPDAVVLDLVLSGKDGFDILEECKNLPNRPKFLVYSALSSNAFVQKALNLGVDYYLLKPSNPKTIEERLEEILRPAASEKVSPQKVLDEKITNIFITVGIPAHIKGYYFLRDAVKMAVENPAIINSITKKLYPSIAERYETSASKVERAIRHAIEVAWTRGKIERINSIFGIDIYGVNEKPTNGEFIALVADKMLLEA